MKHCDREADRDRQGIHTILRDRTTTREDFIFFADRLATLVIEAGMNLLPFAPCEVITPTGATSKGLKLAAEVRPSTFPFENTLKYGGRYAA